MNEIKNAAIYSPEVDPYGIGLAFTFVVDKGLRLTKIYMGKESLEDFATDYVRGNFDVIIIRNADVLSEDTEGLLTVEDIFQLPFIGAEDLYYTKKDLNIETMQYELLDTTDKSRWIPRPKKSESAALDAVIQDKKSYWKGSTPFGFIKENRKYIPDPALAPVIEQIYTKALEGERYTDIATWLDKEGVPVPSIKKSSGQNKDDSARWSINTIRDILRNDKYTKGIISQELFNRVQARFSDSLEEKKDKPVPEERPRGLYQGMVYCGTCKRLMAYQGIGTNRRKTAMYSCKFHTGANPRSEALDHMPKVGEEELKKEVLRQCNNYISDMSNDKKLDAATGRLKKKQEALEKKIKNIGEKVIQNRAVKNAEGLWFSWEAARRKYLAAVSYRILMKHQFQIFHIGHMDEKDLSTERKLIDTITVGPDGTVKVNFKGDWIFK